MKRYWTNCGILVIIIGTIFLSACKKDYYIDGGLAKAQYDGSIYDYLSNDPYWFDTVTYIIDRAGLKDMLSNDTVTFFAPTDDAIKAVMVALNQTRYANVEDSVHIQDIDSSVWRYFLSMYILKGKYLAQNFARVDPVNVTAYPGIDYVTYGGFIVNIGLEYGDYNNVQAVGARIILLTDITNDPNNFRSDPAVTVMSSDIQPTNGVLHVLNNNNILGFQTGRFVQMAEQYLLLDGK